jgi:hypothetical protein
MSEALQPEQVVEQHTGGAAVRYREEDASRRSPWVAKTALPR